MRQRGCVCRGGAQGLLFLPGAGQKPPDFLPFKDHDGKYRTQLDGDFRIGGDVAGEAEGMADQDKVSRGRDGQKLSESFDDSQVSLRARGPIHSCVHHVRI